MSCILYRSQLLTVFILVSLCVTAQYPTSCASVGSRANSNGQATSCPNANGLGGGMATNFALTTYATVPTSSKTGNLQFNYTGGTVTLTPFAITNVWITNGGTSLPGVSFGPASPPTVSGGAAQVSYCFYGNNLPTAGTLSFQLTNPQTGAVWGICSYDASCNSSCTVVANPPTLPVTFTSFTAENRPDGTIGLSWATATEQNNSGFYIERSVDDSNFLSIGLVPSAFPAGTGYTPAKYNFVDQNPAEGHVLSYRIRQKDFDGHSSYSQIVTIKQKTPPDVTRVYSAGNTLYVVVSTPSNAIIYDAAGQTLRHIPLAGAGSFPIIGLAGHSLYYVAVISNGSRVVKSVFIE